MRRILLIALTVVTLAFIGGCGSTAEKSATPETEIPDAVAVVDETTAAESTESADGGAAEISIEGAGFATGNEGEVGYGLVLHNTSADQDATAVEITVNLLDKSGTVLETENQSLNLIPAGEKFYFGGAIYVTGKGKPKKMEAFVDVSESAPAAYKLPAATHVRIINEEYTGIVVKGQVTNDFEGTLSSLAHIGCVLFDDNDKVVGGGFTYLDADLKPGRTASFQFYNGVSCTSVKKAARAEVSIDNSFNE